LGHCKIHWLRVTVLYELSAYFSSTWIALLVIVYSEIKINVSFSAADAVFKLMLHVNNSLVTEIMTFM